METDQQDDSKVLNFRLRTLTGSRDRKDNVCRDENICQLLDLSRYQMRREGQLKALAEDYERRAENAAQGLGQVSCSRM